MTKRVFNYSMVRVVCQGKIKVCEFCKSVNDDGKISEGYCSQCGRPLWKKPGDLCGFILGYYDRDYHKEGKVHMKCKFCNNVTSI